MTNPLTDTFGADKIGRSMKVNENTCPQCHAHCMAGKMCHCGHLPKPRPAPCWDDIDKIAGKMYKACHPETGKLWLVQECLVWNPDCEAWECKVQGVHELPALYKPAKEGDEPVTLPSFDGPLEVLLNTGEPATLYGGSEIPADLSGAIMCINGGLCYLPGNVAVNIPDEVQVGGEMPAADSTVEFWVTPDGPKTKNDEGIWVAVPNYKGK